MSSNTGLYFAQFPKNFDKLRAVLVGVKDGRVGEESVLGPRQFYREVIFTEADLLIAPESEESVASEKAVIIAESHLFESGKVHNTLEKFSLKKESSIPLTRSLFMYCFVFVLTHRLAPLWNKIDKYFLQGRDFLAEDKKIPAIQADFCLTDKITLAVKARLVKLPKLKVEDFGISPNILQKFHQSEEFSIHGYSLENNKCLVLPSLKTGYIASISHRDFEGIDFKRYWKVMYGFRLPVEDPKKAVYYSIRFATNGKILSYPECCIRHKEPQISVRCEHKAIFKSFLEDLTLRMPSVCGSSLTFTSSTLYPTNILHLASVSKQTNLTRAVTLSKANQPFTCTKKTRDISNALNGITRLDRNNPIAKSDFRPQSDSPTGGRHGISLQHVGQTCVVRAQKNIWDQCEGNLNITQLNTHVPQSQCFTASKTSLEVASKVLATKPYVPVFTKHNSVLSKKTTLPKHGELRKEPLVPCFKKGKPSTNKTKLHIKPCSKVKAKVVRSSGSTLSTSNVRSTGGDDESRLNRSASTNDSVVVCQSRLSLLLNRKCAGSGILNAEKTGESEVGRSSSGASQLAEQRIASHALNEANSRTLVEQHQSVAMQSIEHQRKNAKDPKLDVIVNVRKMVAENKELDKYRVKKRLCFEKTKLSKVSAAAITKWLKSEGVKCKCKEKKQDLMLKVYQHLDLVQPEP